MEKLPRGFKGLEKKCCMKDCTHADLLKIAKFWHPVVGLYAKGYPRDKHLPATMTLSLMFCEKCKEKFEKGTPKEFVSEFFEKESINKIRFAFNAAGIADPDFEKPDLCWSEVE